MRRSSTPAPALDEAGLPELPAGWAWTTLGDMTRPLRAKAQPSACPDVPFVGMEHVEAQTMRLLGTVPAQTMRSAALRFRAGDVLYGRLRPYLNKVLRPEFDGLCSAEFLIFPGDGGVDSRFIQYLLNSAPFVAFSSHLNEGDRPRVDFEQLAGYTVPLPPPAEQQRIVAEIEKQVSRLDAGVAALERVRAGLKRYRAAVLQAACTGRLVPTEAELAGAEGRDYEPAGRLLERILAERRSRWEEEQRAKPPPPGRRPRAGAWKTQYQEPAPPDTSDLPALPAGWAYSRIGPLLSLARTGMKTGPFGSLLKKHEHRPEGVPVLGIENIEPLRFTAGSRIHITPQKADDLAGYDAEPGDLLVSRSGTVGEVCVVPPGVGVARISSNVMRVTLHEGGIAPHFMALLLNGSPVVLQQVSDLCSGSTREFLNQHIVASIVFPIPPLAEQERIVAEVERRLSVVDELEAVVAANLKRAGRLRQAILKRAFEGRLVPQDPEDEPAGVLLERIRGERRGGQG